MVLEFPPPAPTESEPSFDTEPSTSVPVTVIVSPITEVETVFIPPPLILTNPPPPDNSTLLLSADRVWPAPPVVAEMVRTFPTLDISTFAPSETVTNPPPFDSEILYEVGPAPLAEIVCISFSVSPSTSNPFIFIVSPMVEMVLIPPPPI